MKPGAHEFTGVKPFNECEHLAPSAQIAMDLLDETKMFCLGDLKPEELIHIHTAEGSVTLARPPEVIWGAGISSGALVVESTIEGIEDNEFIRLDGCSTASSSYAQSGFIGQFGHLMYSRFPKRLLPEEEVAYFEGLEPDDRVQALIDIPFITIEDGKYYTKGWDMMYHRTAEIIRAEREMPDEELQPIFL